MRYDWSVLFLKFLSSQESIGPAINNSKDIASTKNISAYTFSEMHIHRHANIKYGAYQIPHCRWKKQITNLKMF